MRFPAAFGRLRVETLSERPPLPDNWRQPPSGGCVLKRHLYGRINRIGQPAAFGRLRVETPEALAAEPLPLPAAFGRLRVDTSYTNFRCLT